MNQREIRQPLFIIFILTDNKNSLCVSKLIPYIVAYRHGWVSEIVDIAHSKVLLESFVSGSCIVVISRKGLDEST